MSFRGGGIKNTQTVTEEGKYSLDAVQNNPEFEGSLRSEVNKRVVSGITDNAFVNKKGVNDGETVDVSLTLPEDGFYLIQIIVSPCGANHLTKENPYFICQLLNNENVQDIGGRSSSNINIVKNWDYNNIVTTFLKLKQGTLTARFESYLGGQLSEYYNSTFFIKYLKL